MTIEELTAQIGKLCNAKDPRSRKGLYKPGVITAVEFKASKMNDTVYSFVSYTVQLHETTFPKSGWLKKSGYQRSFQVGEKNIYILNDKA